LTPLGGQPWCFPCESGRSPRFYPPPRPIIRPARLASSPLRRYFPQIMGPDAAILGTLKSPEAHDPGRSTARVDSPRRRCRRECLASPDSKLKPTSLSCWRCQLVAPTSQKPHGMPRLGGRAAPLHIEAPRSSLPETTPRCEALFRWI